MLCAASLPALAADAERPAPAPTDKIAGAYLVFMSADPVVTYRGGVSGLDPTAVTAGDALDTNDQAVAAYASHLLTGHDVALSSAGVDPAVKLYDYVYAANGFAALLTPSEAAAIATQPDVLAIVHDEMRRPATDSTPDFLDITDPRGPWATGYTGEGVVIGVIDTGIWPEHPSFADDGRYRPLVDGFSGAACEFGSGPADAPFECGGKVVSAQAFNAGFTADPSRVIAPSDHLSTRDATGHGSHTAATAAGNQSVPLELESADVPRSISGIAPRARIAAYKACWLSDAGTVGCAVSDLVAAIDQAVADGVDVISYAISADSTVLGADDIAFMYAAAAGVMVAAAAGNGGSTAGSIRSPGTAPWVTTVAASSEDRGFRSALTLGDGTVIEGLTLADDTAPLPLLDAADLGNPTCDPSEDFTESIAGAMVLCEQSPLDLGAVATALSLRGGARMIVASDGAGAVARTGLPLLAVDPQDGARISAYIAGADGVATGSLSAPASTAVTPSIIAPFSARGPNPLAPDILKPDVTAPGIGIIAASTPASATLGSQSGFAAESGTSIAAAHVAGVYALIRQAHPTWSAAAAKSALVTTANREVWIDEDLTPADALAAGSGLIQPGGAIARRGTPFNPGLVYETGAEDAIGFLCGLDLAGIGSAVRCGGAAIAARDFNLPSIGVASVVGTATITRTVTSVADKTRVFEARIDAPPGFFVEVNPATITIAPGESAQYQLTITPTRACRRVAAGFAGLGLRGLPGHQPDHGPRRSAGGSGRSLRDRHDRHGQPRGLVRVHRRLRRHPARPGGAASHPRRGRR